MISTAPSHTDKIFDINEFPKVVKWATKMVKLIKPEAMLVCGFSGLILAGAISDKTKIPIIAIRKPDEKPVADPIPTHLAIGKLEKSANRWVWLDDVVISGGTMFRAITHAKDSKLISNDIPVAAILYGSSTSIVYGPKGDKISAVSMYWDAHYSEYKKLLKSLTFKEQPI